MRETNGRAWICEAQRSGGLALACWAAALAAALPAGCLRFQRGGPCPPGYRKNAEALCERDLDTGPPCASDAECDDGNPCTVDLCASGTCHWRPLPERSPCPLALEAGTGMCSAEARCLECLRPADCDDGLQCTQDRCEEGRCRNDPYRDTLDAAVPCRLDGGGAGVCSPRGVCVECLYNWHCSDGGTCQWSGSGPGGVCRW